MSDKKVEIAYWLIKEMEDNISFYHALAASETAIKEDDPDFILIYLEDHKFHRPTDLRDRLHEEWNKGPEKKTDEVGSISWKQLGEEIQKMPKEFLNQTVTINDHGSETIAERLKYGRCGPYLKGF